MAWEYLQLLLELSLETRSKHDRSAASRGQVLLGILNQLYLSRSVYFLNMPFILGMFCF